LNETEKENLKRKLPFYPIQQRLNTKECAAYFNDKRSKQCFNKTLARIAQRMVDSNNFEEPLKKSKHEILLTLKINTNGKVELLKVNTDNPTLKKAIIRGLKEFPDFLPGEQRGQKVSQKFNLPLDIQINK
jgi:hypothetical protein